MTVAPFAIAVPDEVLDDLRARLVRTRFAVRAAAEPWASGTDPDYLRELVAYWADGFDWRAQERGLNQFQHFRARLDGAQIHFDVVIPSLPGYGFSQRPARSGVNYRHVAGFWHRLMQGLGYQRYGAGG